MSDEILLKSLSLMAKYLRETPPEEVSSTIEKAMSIETGGPTMDEYFETFGRAFQFQADQTTTVISGYDLKSLNTNSSNINSDPFITISSESLHLEPIQVSPSRDDNAKNFFGLSLQDYALAA
jgi:hypothetical protein